jgi:hypothetical protein
MTNNSTHVGTVRWKIGDDLGCIHRSVKLIDLVITLQSNDEIN